jgi:putative ABC transport system substrate-binding protein
MKRRDLMTVLCGAAIAMPFAAHAQPRNRPVIGWLGNFQSDAVANPFPSLLPAFLQGLGEAGYVDGQTVAIEYRFAEGHYDRLPALAADLVSREVHVLVAAMATPAALAAKSATSTIPIVFCSVNDPVGIGLVASLARPGGNITGFTNFTGKLSTKLIELLMELVPRTSVIALLVNPNNPASAGTVGDVQEVARTKGLQLVVLKAGTAIEIDAAFAALVQKRAGALVLGSDVFFASKYQQIVALTLRDGIPAIDANGSFADSGGLIGYGVRLEANYHGAGIYVGKILKGATPADLPVQQPAIFELVVNLKTANALGLTVPAGMLARADKLIE